tara:strand:- start:3279 stop:5075 length:1797 start_codon:yes stop_codon:yes gene_type:complete
MLNKNMKLAEDFGIINLLLRVWNNIYKKRKIQLSFLLILMILSGLAEASSIASVIPFLSILSNPDKIDDMYIIKSLKYLFNINDNSELVTYLTALFCMTIVIASLIKLLNIRFNGLLGAAIGSDLSFEAYKRNLYQPYEMHLQQNTSEVISELGNFTQATTVFMNCSLILITNIIITILLLIALFYLSFKPALMLGSIFIGTYLIISKTANRILIANGKLVARTMEQQVQTIQEGLGAKRDLILDNTYQKYLSRFKSVDMPMRKRQADNNFISSAPRFILEALGILVIVLLGYFITRYDSNQSKIIPLLGMLALGSQRLLPSLNQIFFSWSSMKYRGPFVKTVINSIEKDISANNQFINLKKLNFKESIEFRNVYYKYKNREKYAIKNLNFRIRKGERIGIIGMTGCGKTTLIDVLIGLLKPTKGEILIDNKNLYDYNQSKFLPSWRKAISHVPQNIYLNDSTISENIGFIDKKEDLNFTLIRKAAKMANIDSFIKSLPKGLETLVGERGLKLSGGQRQRIGIARAFYKDSDIFVFDEATSALDNNTEVSVMESINNISRDLTLIIVAHRLSTVNKCDRIFKMHDGEIIEIGEPKDIL